MSVQLTPSKRHHEQSPGEINGVKKWHKTTADDSHSRKSPGRNIIRLLYPASKIDNFVGENGYFISEICQLTGAKVHIEETISGCDERVILITLPDKDSEVGADKVKAEYKETEVPESGNDADKQGETYREKQAVIPVADPQFKEENETSLVQKALLSVFDKLIDGFSEIKDGGEESDKPSSYVVRLLIFSSQVDYLLGKAGTVIKEMSSESGAEIRVLPKDKLPSCASSSDDLLQITGVVDVIKKALHSVSEQLLANHLPEQDSSVDESSHFIATTPPPKEQDSSVDEPSHFIATTPPPKEQDSSVDEPSHFIAVTPPHKEQDSSVDEPSHFIALTPPPKEQDSSVDEPSHFIATTPPPKEQDSSVDEPSHFIATTPPPKEQDSSVDKPSHFIATTPPPPKHDRLPSSNRHFRTPNSSRFPDGETFIHGKMNFRPDFLSFRMLCSEDKVGGVIGKGGHIVKGLQHETGCAIKVQDRVAGCQERIIIISGPAHPDDRISPPQDALLRVQDRIFRSAPESKEKVLTAKILVSSSQIGCLLGKGGSVIAEMRKSTGAYIRIIGKEQNPKCTSENEEVVQVNGEFEVVQEALIHITARLKDLFFREAFAQMGPPPFPDQRPPFPPFMGRREFSPPRMFPNRGPPPFNKFDGPGPVPFGGSFPPHDDHPPFPHDFHGPGIPPHLSERWGPQGHMDRGHPMGFPDFPGPPPPPQRRPSVFSGGNPPAVITSTTVEVVVPSYLVPAIYGDGGGCLRQICEISDAKVTIDDPKPGALDTRIVIYGTPEQTNAAQSLIQAFVISETVAT